MGKAGCPFSELTSMWDNSAKDKCPYPQYAYKSEVKKGECPYPELVKASDKCPIMQARTKQSGCPLGNMSSMWTKNGGDACPYPELAKKVADGCPVFKAGAYEKTEGKCPFPE